MWETLDLKASDRTRYIGDDWGIVPRVIFTPQNKVLDCGGEIIVAFQGEFMYC